MVALRTTDLIVSEVERLCLVPFAERLGFRRHRKHYYVRVVDADTVWSLLWNVRRPWGVDVAFITCYVAVGFRELAAFTAPSYPHWRPEDSRWPRLIQTDVGNFTRKRYQKVEVRPRVTAASVCSELSPPLEACAPEFFKQCGTLESARRWWASREGDTGLQYLAADRWLRGERDGAIRMIDERARWTEDRFVTAHRPSDRIGGERLRRFQRFLESQATIAPDPSPGE